ncbi:unnamed protein product [Aureobasidium vineae]|uniref:DUF7587 domain-containing protein n=1 Tax=Aureobasidium vineae TaxID=2773715 RepID=A0A9N8PAY3_9PEZI|nr:unnamed protein product [Aureobasidium vineae]
MPSQKVFHLWPYHTRFVADRLFYNGKYMNPSSHEYAVWATIPRTAILHDFAFADLERHLIGNPYMASVFRIDEMRTEKGNTHIRREFKKDNLNLTLATMEGIARLMPQFGITVTSPASVIARLISEIIRSFEIDLPKTTPKQWDVLGGAFAFALSFHGERTNVAEVYLERAKQAFLSGARTGLGELNWHLNAQKQARMVKKGLSLGLGVGQADTARLEVNKTFQRTIARFAYQGDREEHNEDMMIDDNTLMENAPINKNYMSAKEKKNKDRADDDENDDALVEDEEEAETDIEETIMAKTPPSSQRRRVSYAREATHSSKKINETFIIYDCSDDEDYVADSDME